MRTPRIAAIGLLGALGLLVCAIPRHAVAQEVQAVPGPSGLQATAVSSSRIDLTWTKVNTGQVVEYRLYYADGTLVARMPSSQTGYSDTGLQPWTEYRYYITGASSSGNESGPSNIASARTLDGSPPTAPGILSGVASGSREITLTWTAASDTQSGVSEYVVYRDDSEVGRTTQLSYIDGSLQRDTQYSYKVSAVNGQGDEGAPAGPFQVRTPPPSPPGSPRDLSAEALSPYEVGLNWRPPQDDDDVDGYRVYRNGSPIATTSSSDYRDTGLSPFTVYEYQVTAFDDDDDESAPSNAASVRTLDATPPTVPGNLAGSAVSQTQISLTWAAAADPQTGVAEYVVYRGGSEIGRTASLAYQDDGLTPDTQYGYGVSAINGQGDEGSRAEPIQVRTLADPTPDPPRNLTATAYSPTAIDLSWLPPANESKVASYLIYRDGSAVGTTEAASFRDSGLQSYVSYEYRITAVGAGGEESGPSNAASARTLDGTAPTEPGSLVGTALSQTQVSLSWSEANDPESGISEYLVYRDGGEIARTAALSYDDGGLQADQVYEYEVSAVNGQGDQGNRAGPVEVRTLSDAAPDPPTGLAAQAVDEITVDLTWDVHPDDHLDGYRVYRDGFLVAETGATTYRDGELAPFTTYVYTVTAVAEDGDESAPSVSAAVTTPDVTAPTVPQDVFATAVGTQRIDLTWLPSSDDESGILGYRVFRDGGAIAETESAAFQDSGLAPGTTYEYRVSALNGAGLESDLSDAASATTLTDEGPPAPTSLTATPLDASQIRLEWTAPEPGAASYNVFRDQVFIGTVMATAFVDTGLQPATTYLYSVASVDSDGVQGPLSAQISATTSATEDVVPPAAPTGLRLIAP